MGFGSLKPGRRAIFLDRDGVVNQAVVRDGKPFPPANLSELVVNPDAERALALLKQLGFLLIVVTNQPDVGRGVQSRAAVEEIHDALWSKLPIDEFFVCYHDDREGCDCRKPAPGLILRAAEEHAIRLTSSFLVGDRWRDVDAGFHAGVQTVLIDYGYSERGPDHEPAVRVKSLMEAAEWISRIAAPVDWVD
jgi:D-glycero-D-manno-heptose 1,7-bisphosphate phosphatase